MEVFGTFTHYTIYVDSQITISLFSLTNYKSLFNKLQLKLYQLTYYDEIIKLSSHLLAEFDGHMADFRMYKKIDYFCIMYVLKHGFSYSFE